METLKALSAGMPADHSLIDHVLPSSELDHLSLPLP